MAGSVPWICIPEEVTSNASTTTRGEVEAAFIRPVASIVNVWLASARPVFVKRAAWICSAGEYVSTSATRAPSRNTSAIPFCGPRAPIQLTDVPEKANVACDPEAVADAAAPALHGLPVSPCVQPAE